MYCAFGITSKVQYVLIQVQMYLQLEKCPATAWGITNEKTAVANYTSLGASVDETRTCTLKLRGDKTKLIS